MGIAVQVLKGMLKSPVVSMSEINSGLAPTLVRVTFMVLPVVFTPWLPKAMDVAEMAAEGVVTPVPVN